MRRRLLIFPLLAVSFGAITLVALEGREVVLLETRAEDGSARQTRTWIAEDAGAWWVEAANPERPFLLDLQARPEVELQRSGRPFRCRAEVSPEPGGHDRIRQLLRARYGWADRWVALIADTSRSLAVRLDCQPRS